MNMNELITPERQKAINAWKEFKQALLECIEPFCNPILNYLDKMIKRIINNK